MKVWAYIHPELNILCCAVFPETVPEGVNAIEFEVEDINDIIFDGQQIRLKTYEEKLNELKQRKIQELKQYVALLLAPTDYILFKIQEAQATGQDIQPLLTKYVDKLTFRTCVRAWNEEMKTKIKNTTTIEELRNIEINFGG